jgi:mRNA-degrading endonuclease YafQ of YafQ-DinJ toxin-antitoxin module
VTRALIQSPTFLRAARRFIGKHPGVADDVRSTLKLLSEDAFDPCLRTHKLKGRLAGCWASSAGYDVRIVFEFVSQGGEEAILLLSIGTHDEVY